MLESRELYQLWDVVVVVNQQKRSIKFSLKVQTLAVAVAVIRARDNLTVIASYYVAKLHFPASAAAAPLPETRLDEAERPPENCAIRRLSSYLSPSPV